MQTGSSGKGNSVGGGRVGSGEGSLGSNSKHVSRSGLAGLQLITIHWRSSGTVERSDSYLAILTSPLTSMGDLGSSSRLECFLQSRYSTTWSRKTLRSTLCHRWSSTRTFWKRSVCRLPEASCVNRSSRFFLASTLSPNCAEPWTSVTRMMDHVSVRLLRLRNVVTNENSSGMPSGNTALVGSTSSAFLESL